MEMLNQNELLNCTITQQSALNQTRKKSVNEIGLNKWNRISVVMSRTNELKF